MWANAYSLKVSIARLEVPLLLVILLLSRPSSFCFRLTLLGSLGLLCNIFELYLTRLRTIDFILV